MEGHPVGGPFLLPGLCQAKPGRLYQVERSLPAFAALKPDYSWDLMSATIKILSGGAMRSLMMDIVPQA